MTSFRETLGINISNSTPKTSLTHAFSKKQDDHKLFKRFRTPWHDPSFFHLVCIPKPNKQIVPPNRDSNCIETTQDLVTPARFTLIRLSQRRRWRTTLLRSPVAPSPPPRENRLATYFQRADSACHADGDLAYGTEICNGVIRFPHQKFGNNGATTGLHVGMEGGRGRRPASILCSVQWPTRWAYAQVHWMDACVW